MGWSIFCKKKLLTGPFGPQNGPIFQNLRTDRQEKDRQKRDRQSATSVDLTLSTLGCAALFVTQGLRPRKASASAKHVALCERRTASVGPLPRWRSSASRSFQFGRDAPLQFQVSRDFATGAYPPVLSYSLRSDLLVL